MALRIYVGMDALLIVDFQNDFTPGGALAVQGGDEIGRPLNAIADRFDLVVATRDWHPPDHGSFVGVEVDPEKWEGIDPPGIWPPHCVQGTPGAELHASLDRAKVDVDRRQGAGPEHAGLLGLPRRRTSRTSCASAASTACSSPGWRPTTA